MDNINNNRKKIILWALNNIVWGILVAILIIFSITIKGFWQWSIFQNILYHSVFVGILAISNSLCVLIGEMDLSTESVMALSGTLTAYLAGTGAVQSGLQLNGITTLAIMLIAGLAIGLFNSFFIIKLKINSFIITLAGYLAFRSVGLVITKGRGIYSISDDILWVARTNIGPIPLMVIILFSMYIIFAIILNNFRLGRYIYFIGGNRQASYNVGIKVNKVTCTVLVLSSVLSAIAGWLMAGRLNGSSPSLGQGMLFDSLAALVIGGVSLKGGVGSLSGVFAGTIILSSISTVIAIVGIDPYYTNIIRGGLILLQLL